MSNRPNMREDVRSDQRELTPRERADLRAKEILSRNANDLSEVADKFDISYVSIPDGWTYEWKTFKVMNQEDPGYMAKLARLGWEAVPRKRHPELMPADYTEPVIIREGMILMERPTQITEHVRKQLDQNARAQVRAKEQQLGASGAGEFERNAPQVRKNFEKVDIPEDFMKMELE